MKTFHFFIITSVIVIIAVIVVIKFPIHYESTVVIPRKLSEIVLQPSIQAKHNDENQARTMAESSPIVKAVLMTGSYHYDSIFYSGNKNGTFVNVVYQSNNGTSGPLVVTEDRNSTKIIHVEFQPFRHY